MNTQQLTATPLTTALTTNLQPRGLQTGNPLNLTTQALVGASQVVTHTFTVTNVNDSGAGSLRQAILNANADSTQTPGVADVINFNLGTGAHTITLTSDKLDIIAKNLTINGTGANNLVINGGKKFQDFAVESGASVTLSGLTIANGLSATSGAGIFNNGTLTLNNSTLLNNSADTNLAVGGGIFNAGSLTANGDTFINNTALSNAGGALFNAGNATITNSNFTSNAAVNGGAIENSGTLTIATSFFASNNGTGGFGGGIANVGSSTLTVTDSTFFNNSASGGDGGGILNNNASKATVSNSTFINNTAAFGAGLFNDTTHGATLNVSGLTFAGNLSTQSAGTLPNNNDIYNFLTNVTVDSLLDTNDTTLTPGHISLRDAVQVLAPGGTINFASTLAGGTITLTLGELDLNNNLTIQGLGANKLTISGNQQFRDFAVGSGANVTISGLTIANGNSANGGGILNNGTLTLNGDNFSNNTAQGFGGGVNNNGVLTINGGTFSHNTSAFGGGAIGNGNQLTINGSTFDRNSATTEGGAIDNSGNFTINNSTFTNNTAATGGAIFMTGLGAISGSTFTNNTAQNGGAISNGGTLTLIHDTISNNKALNAQGVGGGIWNKGLLTLDTDSINSNSAGFEGGGIFNAAGNTVNSHNTTITNNTAFAAPDIFGTFTSQGGNTIGILDGNATGFINGQNGDVVQNQPKMESYTFIYNYTAQPIINGGATPQDYLGVGFAAIGTYRSGQTISIKNGIGQVVGTYTIKSVNDNTALNANQLNHVNITEYDYDLGGAPVVTKITVGRGLDPNSGGVNGLGSERGTLIGLGAEGTNVTFSNQTEAIHPIHF